MLKSDQQNDHLLKNKEFKDQIKNLLTDYIEVKKEALNLGYDAEAFKFKDYMDYYIRLSNK